MSKRRDSRLYWNRSRVELGYKLPTLSPYLPIYDQGITPCACYLALIKPKIFHIFSLHAHQTCPGIQVTVSCIDILAFLFLIFICSKLGKVSYLRTPCQDFSHSHREPSQTTSTSPQPMGNDRLTNEWLTTFKALTFYHGDSGDSGDSGFISWLLLLYYIIIIIYYIIIDSVLRRNCHN